MGTSPAEPAELRARLPGLMLRDQRRLGRRLDGASGARKRLGRIAADIEAAELRIQTRRATLPEISYPENLPITAKRDEILEAIGKHQVVIVAGETGSGKTTQLPKICLELGRGISGVIGHTQPRRLAARTVAERIAEELSCPLGQAIGYKVRFTDHSSDDTLVKLMTDGILLAEMQQDRTLDGYDTLIIDEAHERSLNIDFILGYVRRLLPERPDLKVIITSATIDPDRFSRHFGDAPIIEVSGRTYPVEVRYRPISPEHDQTQAITDAVVELSHETRGDILVFLSGEREIRDTADALKGRPEEVLPLYARLSAAEQHRVFQPHGGRRIILATNVAETSLTVPGIKYVIDPGTARISRYSHRLKVQRLPIEAVSQASANQRKGRCGRTSDGICVRLYAEEDFASRPEFTDPEILRTNLASVILQMTALGLGDIEAFPFLDPPDRRQVKDGVLLLQELGALDGTKLTRQGRALAQLPVDPRLARMVLQASENGCAKEVMIIAAALSIQDPRERPADRQQAADEKHVRFKDKESDFIAYLNLWDYLREQQRALSSSQFRRLCKAEFLHYLRVREWQDVFSQLRQVAASLGVTQNAAPAEPYRIHVSLLAGLLSHIGLKDVDKGEYGGARGARFAIFPGSSLFKKQPRWVMAAELVETSRLWGRINAKIEPEWVEPLAQHLVKRAYSEPHWEKMQAAVMAYEKVTLYGVPIVAQRKINYGRIDPILSRELFIRHALVEGDWQSHHRFLRENRELLDEVEELEHRARRRDILVDDQTLFDFYHQRIPQEVVSGRHFDAWWKQARTTEADLLTFTPEMLIQGSAVDEDDHPGHWQQNGLRFRLTYQFEPGAEADGVTVHIPLRLLNQVSGQGFDWQIPGLREELVTAHIRALPKHIRRNFVPAPDHAKAVLDRIKPEDGPLLEAMRRELANMTGVRLDAGDWGEVPPHLRMTFRIEDAEGRPLGEGKDLNTLKEELIPSLRATLAEAADGIEQRGLRAWSIGALPRTFQRRGMVAYPALVDEGGSVGVRMLESEAEQRRAMWEGTRRLLLLNVPSPAKAILGGLTNRAKLALSRGPYGSAAALFDDCVMCAIDKIIEDGGGPAWGEDGFRTLQERARAELFDTAADVVEKVERILAVAHELELRLKGQSGPAVADMTDQLAGLVYPGFITATGWSRLPDVHRYLRGIERRLEKLPDDPGRDHERMLTIHGLAGSTPEGKPGAEIRWMIEELRISFFAQQLGTPQPISAKRILRAISSAAPPARSRPGP